MSTALDAVGLGELYSLNFLRGCPVGVFVNFVRGCPWGTVSASDVVETSVNPRIEQDQKPRQYGDIFR
jgi:hypothetical protein